MSAPPKPTKKAYEGPRHTFDHPQLGNLCGRLVASTHFPNNDVVQFRSIPYATIPKRFLPSVRLETIPDSFDNRESRDFTNFGAACPQTGGQSPNWCDPYGGPLEDDLGFEFDEDTCLTVSITVPKAHLDQAGDNPKLPVMVYVHGGGAQDGVGHVDGCHSGAPLTSFSNSISQPVILVNVGYRLNWFGTLTCQDLLDEYSAAPSSPQGPFNLSLQDQRNAFLWIQDFIEGFGGDSHNITAFGESAGSFFLSYHICGSPIRLFDRAILQSGLVFGDLPLKTKEREYQDMLKYFKIDGATVTERPEALRNVDPNELAKYPGSHMTPYIGPIPGVAIQDSLFSRELPTITAYPELIVTCEWLGDLMIGDDFWEGQVFLPVVNVCSQTAFQETIKSVFPASEADALLKVYDLPASGTVEKSRALMPISHFYGDMVFSGQYHILARVLAQHASKTKRKIYRYSFAMSNPFPGTFFSFSPGHHFLEILFIFLTFLDRYPTHRDNWAARQAKETASRWIAFANGNEPWDPYVSGSNMKIDDARIAICDDIRGWTVRTVKEDEEISRNDPWGERRYLAWETFDAAFNALKSNDESLDVWDNKVNVARLKLLEVVYSIVGIVKVPNEDDLV